MKRQLDKHGREIQVGDLLKVFHFCAAYHGRYIYNYKLVVSLEGHVRLVDVCDIAVTHSVRDAHSCGLSFTFDTNREIIDGPSRDNADGTLQCWWERPKLTAEAGKE